MQFTVDLQGASIWPVELIRWTVENKEVVKILWLVSVYIRCISENVIYMTDDKCMEMEVKEGV